MHSSLAPIDQLSKKQRGFVLENSWSDVADRIMTAHVETFASHLAGSCFKVEHLDDRETPCNNNCFIVAPTYSGKTEAGRKVRSFYDQLAQEYQQNRGEELATYHDKLSSWQSRQSGIGKRIRDIESQAELSDDERNQRLDAAEQRKAELMAEKPAEPLTAPSRGGDATFSGIKTSVTVHQNLLLNADEGALFFDQMDQSIMSIINSSFSGEPNKSLRANANSDPILPILTVCVASQRKPFDTFINSKMGRLCIGSGFFDRFGIVYVSAKDLDQAKTYERPDTDTATQIYFSAMRHFFYESIRLGKNGYADRPTLKLTRSGIRAADSASRCIREVVSHYGSFFDDRTYPGRATERMVRMAATDHTFEGAEGDITGEEIENALQRVIWHIHNYYLLFAESEKHYLHEEDAERVADLLARRGRSFPKTQMGSIELELSMTNARVRNAIAHLIKHGQLKQIEKQGSVHFILKHGSHWYDRVLGRGG